MDDLLKETRHKLKAGSHKTIWIVLGNETGDLDSIVSSLGYAYLKQNVYNPEDIVVPLCNLNREDLRLRTVVVSWLKHCGLPHEDLLFRDDPEIVQLLEGSPGPCDIQLCLVDHNTLSVRDKDRSDQVREVIDHHEISSSAGAPESYDIFQVERVGSCATLVTELCFQKGVALPQQLLTLLYGAIIFDTVCLSEEAGRVTAKDVEFAMRIEETLGLGTSDRAALFKGLRTAQSDIQGLSVLDLLRRDVKFLGSDGSLLAISTVSQASEPLLARSEFLSDIEHFVDHEQLQLSLIGTVGTEPITKEMRRVLIGYSKTRPLLDKLFRHLCKPKYGLYLQESSSPSICKFIRVFYMGNMKANRKVILPLVEQFVNTKLFGVFSETDNNNLLGVPLVNGKGSSSVSPSLRTPSNSYNVTPSEMCLPAKDRLLPSMDNKRTLALVEKKRQAFDREDDDGTGAGIDDYPEEDRNGGDSPRRMYTPANSSSEDETDDDGAVTERRRDHSLPSFYNQETIERVKEKRRHMGSLGEPSDDGYDDTDHLGPQEAFTPANSFTEESPLSAGLPRVGEGAMVNHIQQRLHKLSCGEIGRLRLEADSVESAAHHVTEHVLKSALTSAAEEEVDRLMKEGDDSATQSAGVVVKAAVLRGWAQYLDELDWEQLLLAAHNQNLHRTTDLLSQSLVREAVESFRPGRSLATDGNVSNINTGNQVDSVPLYEQDMTLSENCKLRPDHSEEGAEGLLTTSSELDGQRRKLYPKRRFHFDEEEFDFHNSTEFTLSELDAMATPDLDSLDGLDTPDHDRFFSLATQLGYADEGESLPPNSRSGDELRGSKRSLFETQPPPHDIQDGLTTPELSSRGEEEGTETQPSVMIVELAGESHSINMLLVEPYRRVITHAGYFCDPDNNGRRTALLVFSACYLPNRKDPDYVAIMDSLFYYAMHCLDSIVMEDYALVYFHGGTAKGKIPKLSWLRQCYQMVHHKLRKNLKHLYIVHPTFLVKTIVFFSRLFVSSKFSDKIAYIHSLRNLARHVPTEFINLPPDVVEFEQPYLEKREIVLQILRHLN